MVKYLYSLDNSQPMTVEIVTNAAVVDGDLLAITSGLVGPATAADDEIIGIAVGAAASGGTAKVLLLTPYSVIRCSYISSIPTKRSLAAADRFGTVYDWNATSKAIDLDDTTGGYIKVINYDNGADTADCVIEAASLWNA